MKFLSLVLFFGFATSAMVNAADYAQKQNLFNLVLDLKPNAQFHIKQINGEIPISIITDQDNNISALQVGNDSQSLAVTTDQQKFDMPIYSAVVGQDLAAQKSYKVLASTAVRDNQELFFVDATQLDKEKGGKVILHYPSSLVLGTTNEVELNLRRMKDHWVATILVAAPYSGAAGPHGGMVARRAPEEKIISSATVETSFTGIGLNSPSFQYLDPNEITKQLTISPVHNAAELQARAVQGKEMLNSYKEPLNVPEFGLKVELEESAK